MDNKDKITTITMSQDLYDRAKKKAKENEFNFSTYIRLLIVKDLKEKQNGTI